MLQNEKGTNPSTTKIEDEMTTISLPKRLAERIKRRLSSTDFKSVDEYVGYIVESVLTDLEQDSAPVEKEVSAYSKEDQASVEQRLRDLGYL